MTKTSIAAEDWVVACDGRKALICRNVGDAKFINLQVVEVREIDNPPTSEQGVERPGRVHDATSASRSAVEQTDWHDLAEREFLRGLAARLDQAVAAGEVKHLVLAASPRALGMIRPLLSAPTIAVVRAEIDKDYVNLPIHELEKRLTG